MAVPLTYNQSWLPWEIMRWLVSAGEEVLGEGRQEVHMLSHLILELLREANKIIIIALERTHKPQ